MADLKLIGAVAVKVRPDAKGFRGDTKRQVLKELSGQEFEVEVNLNLDTNEVKEKARRAINDVRREAERSVDVKVGLDPAALRKASSDLDKLLKDFKLANVNVELDKEYLRRAGNQLQEVMRAAGGAGIAVDVSTTEGIKKAKHDIDEFLKKEDGREVKFHADMTGLQIAAAQLKYATRDRQVNFFVKVNEKSLVVAEGLIASLSGMGVLKEVGEGLENLITNFDKIAVKGGMWSMVIGNIVNTLGYVATSAFTAGEGLVQSIGLFATLPTALAAITAGVLINIAAFKNFKGAIDGDAESLAKLPPNAQAAAKSLKGTWESIQKPVQKAFWEGMGDSIQRFAQNTIPVLRDGLTSVADDVGRFNAGILDSFEEIAKNGDLQKMFGNLEGFFQQATAASRPFFDAFNIFGLRGSDYLPRFGGWLADISERFKNWAEESDKAGKINVWIENGVQSLKDMGSLIGSTVDMFKGLTRAVNDAGGGGLPEFRDNMRNIADIMLAEPFRSRMATIFAGAREGASKLNVGIKDLGEVLGKSAGFASDLLKGLGELGGGFVSNISRTLGQIDLQTGLLDGLGDMKVAVRDLGPAFEGLGRIIGNMSRVAGDIFKGIAPVINTVVGFLDTSVGKLAGNMEKVAPLLTGLVNALTTAASGPLTVVVDALNGLVGAFTLLPGPIQLAVAGFATFLALRGPLGSFLEKTRDSWVKFTDATKSGAKAAEGSAKRIGDFVWEADGTVRKFSGAPMVKQLDTIGAKAKSVAKSVGRSLMDFMGGGWGIGLALAGTAITAMGDAAAKQKGKIDDLRTALDGQTSINSATEQVIASQLRAKDSFLWWEQASIADSAQNIGIGLRDIQKAAEGVPESMDKVTAALKRANEAKNIFQTGSDFLGLLGDKNMLGTMSGVGDLIGKLFGSDAAKTSAGLQKIKDDLASARKEVEATAKQLGVPVGASAGILAAIDVLVDKASTADQKLRAVNDIIKQMNGGKSDAGDAVQRSNDAARDFSKNMDAIIEKAKGEGHALPDLFNMTTGEIDTVSGAGSKLRTELKDVADAGRDSALKLALAQKDPQAAVDTLRTEMQKTRDLIARPLELAGIPPYEVDKILDQLDLDPAKIEMLLNPTSRDQALADLAAANNAAQGVVKDPAVKGLDVDASKFDKGVNAANAQSNEFAGKTATSTLDANDGPFKSKVAASLIDGLALSLKTFTPGIDGNDSPFNTTVAAVKAAGSGLTNTTFSPTINVLGGALDYVNNVLGTLNKMNGSVFSATIDILGKVLGGSADGSLNDGRNWDRRFMPKFFANGGIENHVAQIAKPSSTLRVWAEPETGGEAYIPLAASKRARSTAILDEVASKFGYELVRARKFADGGIVGGPASGGGVSVHIDAKPGIAYQYAKEVGAAAEQRFRDAQVLYDITT